MGLTQFLLLSNIAANATQDMMVNADTGESEARFITRPSVITMAIDASAVGVELEVFVGSLQVVPRSTLDAGGTTGVFPNLDQKAFRFRAPSGVLRVIVREIAGTATTDIQMALSVEP